MEKRRDIFTWPNLVLFLPLVVGLVGLIGVLAEGDVEGSTKKFTPYPQRSDWTYVKLRAGEASEWKIIGAGSGLRHICLSWYLPGVSEPRGVRVEI